VCASERAIFDEFAERFFRSDSIGSFTARAVEKKKQCWSQEKNRYAALRCCLDSDRSPWCWSAAVCVHGKKLARCSKALIRLTGRLTSPVL
jgi:hypothetical protein